MWYNLHNKHISPCWQRSIYSKLWFFYSHVQMWELDHKESWVTKNWCFWTVEKTLESPLDSMIKPVNPKRNQSWIFIGRTDAEAEAPILWPPDVKNWFIVIGKDTDAGKDWSQEETGITEDELVGWHHCLGGHEFEQAPGVGDGQGSLACCSPRTHKELDDWVTKLNWNINLILKHQDGSVSNSMLDT